MTQAIMFQGTASDSGKSWLAAGLCRILRDDGLRVAPFKSQNMALNSFITKEGNEMGRAQVFQAEAAGVAPDVRMNPILLKPSTDKASQVVFLGKVLTDMDAADYQAFKPQLKDKVKQVYQELAAENDVVVLEGAGSPAEINLNENDLVNMGMARMADAPVILVADIDKGGVFAAIYGTIKLMPPADQKRVKGIVINKFRGDETLLTPGNKMIEDLTGVPVLGVIPMSDVDLDEEDSVALTGKSRQMDTSKALDVAVISLTKISNFTDFHSLELQPDVSVRYVLKPEELGQPDLLIIPGSKNTNEDMAYLNQTGLAAAIKRAHQRGSMVCGICGGYQIIGRQLHDEQQVESAIKHQAGLGLIDAETYFNPTKTTTQAEAWHDDFKLTGYEIHMGTTKLGPTARPYTKIVTNNGVKTARDDGAINDDGTVFGTYLHGIFDNQLWTRHLLNQLRERKGLEPIYTPGVSLNTYKEQQYDKLAATLRQHLDMAAIYQILADSAH